MTSPRNSTNLATWLSLSKSAELLGVSKSTISRAIDSGKLSASKTPSGRYQIMPSELTRYRDHVLQPRCETFQENGLERPTQPPENDTATAVLQERLKGLQERVRYLEQDQRRLQQELDDWKDQAKQSTRLLEHKKPKAGLIERFWRRG